ncbi:hypothetical protein E1293_11230 [Actinomadura darangshiensis]|uniref:Uncharacterized protein n=1 Tax=Actinomadura darangshiensis TaxID=705336 RepID=A0A4R5BN85_9ACTN|nr:hypothetical protein [Actinomadura darangshiensis]TDD85354.1 hypothetical protein E1293_11230 [Actinomadura darangshiensis]
MIIVIIGFIAFFYVGLYLAIWATLSFFLPSGVSEPVAVAILVVATVILLWRWAAGSTLLGGSVVKYLHAARRRSLGLPPLPVPLVAPVRLAGLGSRRERFDLSLINLTPERTIGGVRMGALAAVRGRNLYLVMTREDLQLWVRHRLLSFRHAVALDLDQIAKTRFIEHDPDRLGLRDDHARRYVATLDIEYPGSRHLFLYIRVKPTFVDEA